MDALTKPYVVQDAGGYNAWPMIQAIGETLVCVYSRGKEHSYADRSTYARISTDKGKTWANETLVAKTPGHGEVVEAKGLDSKGAMLFWMIRTKGGNWNSEDNRGSMWTHALYRTSDGVTFEHVTTLKLAVTPVQITGIFAVPTVGLMSLWFAGDYKDGLNHSWGILTSKDDGATWTQTVIESNLTKQQWPTEASAVYLGNGKILAVARTEVAGDNQFQMASSDYGATWKRAQTNIGDVFCSTPSLIYDVETGLLSNYYYQRGKGILWRRFVKPDRVFDNPLHWTAPEVVATESTVAFDAGNVNATSIGQTHCIAFYSGKAPDTAILVSVLPAPTTEHK